MAVDNIQKIIIKKKINDVIYTLYPKTTANIVEYNSSTVAEALTNLANDITTITTETTGTIDTRVKTACDNLYNKIMGLTDSDTTIDQAYDTLKEVAAWINEHGDVAAAFSNDITNLKAAVGSIETGGLLKDVNTIKTTIGDENGGIIKDINDINEALRNIDKDMESALATPSLYNATGDPTDVDAAVASLGDIAFIEGDILVITEESTGIAAAYRYNATSEMWEALDGNVSADNVIIKKDITLAGSYTSVGNVSKGSSTATGTLSVAGKSLTDVLQNIFTKELQPTKTEPSVSLTFSKAGAYEVGTKVTPDYSATLNAGSYTYGPATGITPSSWEVTNTDGGSKNTASGSFDEITVGDATNYTITAKATYAAGAVAKTNLGNDSSPVVQIAAGNKSKTSSAITGYRNCFYGSKVNPVELTSANIRALAQNSKSSVNSFSVTVVEGAKQVIIAIPTGKTLKAVADTGAFGTDIVGSFVNNTVAVEGANGYTAKDYNVYVYTPATALGANTYNVTIG